MLPWGSIYVTLGTWWVLSDSLYLLVLRNLLELFQWWFFSPSTFCFLFPVLLLFGYWVFLLFSHLFLSSLLENFPQLDSPFFLSSSSFVTMFFLIKIFFYFSFMNVTFYCLNNIFFVVVISWIQYLLLTLERFIKTFKRKSLPSFCFP